MKTIWISCHKFTCKYRINDSGIITYTAPFIRKFVGQPESNLLNWIKYRFSSFHRKECGLKIPAYKCLTCGDIIYSRARHDYRTCSCEKLAVDGGFNYTRLGFASPGCFEPVEITVAASKQQLYDDWCCRTNKYGLIPNDTSESEVRA